MNLHKDKNAFHQLIKILSDKGDIRTDVLEKDYYVTLMLKEIADHQKETYAFFKGGTALYKALGSIRRFSEDIDLTVSMENCHSNNQKKKRLKNAACSYQTLERDKDAEGNEHRKDSITSVFRYDPIEPSEEDPLARFGYVKIEATSFTVSEPTVPLKISPILFERAETEQKKILRERFEVVPFLIQTISLERIFVDKLFAAEFYYLRMQTASDAQAIHDYGIDFSKHLYDTTVLLQNSSILSFLNDPVRLKKIIDLKRSEELKRKGGISGNQPIRSFAYLNNSLESKKINEIFEEMQKVYVFQDRDKLMLSDTKLARETFRSIEY